MIGNSEACEGCFGLGVLSSPLNELVFSKVGDVAIQPSKLFFLVGEPSDLSSLNQQLPILSPDVKESYCSMAYR